MRLFTVEKWGNDRVLTYGLMHVRFNQYGRVTTTSWIGSDDPDYKVTSAWLRCASVEISALYKIKTGLRRFGPWHSDERRAFLRFMADELNKRLAEQQEIANAD